MKFKTGASRYDPSLITMRSYYPNFLNKAQASSVRVRTAEANVDQRLIEMGKK